MTIDSEVNARRTRYRRTSTHEYKGVDSEILTHIPTSVLVYGLHRSLSFGIVYG